MFSGGDSSEGINSLNQLGAYGFVNQVAVTNAMAAGQNIDWAQLAQQWIQMRDNSEIETKMDPNAASADNVSGPSCNSLRKFEEKGEADMDMDDEEQTDEKTTLRANNEFTATSAVHNNLNQPWYYNEGSSQIASRSANNSQWNAWPNQEIITESNKNVNNISNRPPNPTAHIPSLLKMTVPHPNEIRVMPDHLNQADNSTNMMDAAKRKGLPAWIREGLEKMEREKQKQLEKEQQKKDYTNSSDEDNVSDKNVLSRTLNPSSGGQFAVLDEDSTDDENITITKSTNNETEVEFKKDNEDEDTLNSPVAKTYEQKLADLMIVVRRTLTELLLEATNEEISKVADETIKTFKTKASSAQVIRKSALSTLTGKLGLAAYGDSSSEDNSDDDDDEHNFSKKSTGQSESENDSDEEIRNIIRSKRRAFIKTSEEIEERVASAAAREEEKLKYFSRKEEEEEREHNRKKQERSSLRDQSSSSHSGNNIIKGYEKDFGEITETKIQNLNGKRQRDRSSRRERTTRFSDNKDKYVSLPNAATFLTNMNTAANSGTANTGTSLSNSIQRQNIPDINGLLPSYANTGMTNVLNAADAALEKVLKGKSSSSPEKQSRRHDRDRNYAPSKKRQRETDGKNSRSRSKSSSSSSTSSSSSSTSSDSDSSSTSRSSHHSKYNHRSAKKHKSHSSSDYKKSHKDHRDDRKYSSSYRKKDRESTSRHYHRKGSSDSEEEYRKRHKYDSHYSRNSSHSRSYTSSRRDRDREHSRSQSRSSYSSSSNRRQ